MVSIWTCGWFDGETWRRIYFENPNYRIVLKAGSLLCRLGNHGNHDGTWVDKTKVALRSTVSSCCPMAKRVNRRFRYDELCALVKHSRRIESFKEEFSKDSRRILQKMAEETLGLWRKPMSVVGSDLTTDLDAFERLKTATPLKCWNGGPAIYHDTIS